MSGKGSGRRAIGKEDYQAKGVMYLPPRARFSYLLALPEEENIGKAINEAMKAVEADNEELKGVLPRTYTRIDNLILASLLKNFSQIAVDAKGDKFGRIYEYFLGNFARAEGQRGGEFFTPETMVQLIVEIVLDKIMEWLYRSSSIIDSLGVKIMVKQSVKKKPCCEDAEPCRLPADQSAEQMAALAWAIAHPARVRIVRLLISRSACVCGEIVAEMPLAQSTVSQHLRILKESGLVQGEVDGPRVCYCINPEKLAAFKSLVASL